MKSKYSIVLKSTVITALVFLASSAMAGEGKKRGHRGPPPEAIEACSNAAVDQACEFTGRRGESVSGTCFIPGRGDSQTLACKPTGGRSKEKQDRSEADNN